VQYSVLCRSLRIAQCGRSEWAYHLCSCYMLSGLWHFCRLRFLAEHHHRSNERYNNIIQYCRRYGGVFWLQKNLVYSLFVYIRAWRVVVYSVQWSCFLWCVYAHNIYLYREDCTLLLYFSLYMIGAAFDIFLCSFVTLIVIGWYLTRLRVLL